MAIPRICSVEGCDKPVFSRNQCAKHYDQWRRARPAKICLIETCQKPAKTGNKLCHAHARKKWKYGDPLAGRENGEPTQFYLEALKFDGDDCLIWPFSKNADGYATYKLRDDGRTQILSRRICEDIHGPAPHPDSQAAHSCGKGHEGCISQKHVGWSTPKQNVNDQRRHGTLARGRKKATALLTEDQVREIRNLRSLGGPAVARMYNVSNTAIYSIWNGRKWTWLKD